MAGPLIRSGDSGYKRVPASAHRLLTNDQWASPNGITLDGLSYYMPGMPWADFWICASLIEAQFASEGRDSKGSTAKAHL